MQHGIAALQKHAFAFDAGVKKSFGIDRICSRSAWLVAYHRAFTPQHEILFHEDGDSFAVVCATTHPQLGRLYMAVEHGWCFAAPCVGPQGPSCLADLLMQQTAPVNFLLSGLDDNRASQVLTHCHRSYEIYPLEPTQRVQASLAGGFDGYLARRSKNFRRSTRKEQRRVDEDGLVFEHYQVINKPLHTRLYQRVLDIESASWKGLAGIGVDQDPMRSFYATLLPLFAAQGHARVLIAQYQGRDVAYMHCAVVDTEARGLQLSQRQDVSHLALSKRLHLEMIKCLCSDGVQTYDLGMDVPYKHAWGEYVMRTNNVLAIPATTHAPAVNVNRNGALPQ